MPLRDIVITLIVFGSLPFILSRPYIGVLVWSWLGYMNPHRQSWGFAMDFPFAQIVAITLLVAVLLKKEDKKPPIDTFFYLWLTFIGWMVITSFFAYFPEDALIYLVRVLKIQLIIFVTLMIMKNKERINMMIWVIYLSIGFFGIKGGIFTIATAGSHRVWGPVGTFIADNNHLATALLMVLPLGYYLYRQTADKRIRYALLASMFLIAVSVVGSQSRGAFLAILAVGAMFWWKSKQKFTIGTVVLLLLPVMFMSMPQSWHDRMATIQNYEEDASAMGRINAWTYAVNAASDRITGVGFESWMPETFAIWAPDPNAVHAAHSIYFGVLADHGWPGLAIFLAILWVCWRMNTRIIKVTQGVPAYEWMNDLSKMLQISIVAYMTGGAFLSMAYFDLPWHLFAIVSIMNHIAREQGLLASKRSRSAVRHRPQWN